MMDFWTCVSRALSVLCGVIPKMLKGSVNLKHIRYVKRYI